MLSQATTQRIEHWPIQRLVANPRNPRTHSDSQIAAIAAAIRQYPFIPPTLVDNQRRRARRGGRREG